MTSKELKRLTRSDLLEILFSMSEENEQLAKKLEETQQLLEARRIQMESLGSIAEASLQLNGVFQAAQAACDHYQENVRLRFQRMEQECDRMEKETQDKCAKLEQDTQKKCEEMLANAELEAQTRLKHAEEIAWELYEAFITQDSYSAG